MTKMLSLPIFPARQSLAKFAVLLCLAAIFIFMSLIVYYLVAAIGSAMHDYSFMLSPWFVLKEATFFFLTAIPMLALFWLLSVAIQNILLSAGLGLASVVLSILMINTEFWFIYPMCYPFYVLTVKLSADFTATPIDFFPWLPVAIGITIICLILASSLFGRKERR